MERSFLQGYLSYLRPDQLYPPAWVQLAPSEGMLIVEEKLVSCHLSLGRYTSFLKASSGLSDALLCGINKPSIPFVDPLQLE